jgi:hypothetical protein
VRYRVKRIWRFLSNRAVDPREVVSALARIDFALRREGLLSVIRESLSPSQRSRLLLLADRGYASSAFFRRLRKAHIAFCIRVPRRVLLTMAHQQLLWWEARKPEPWLIATTLSSAEET